MAVDAIVIKPFRRWEELKDMCNNEREIWEVEEVVNSIIVKGDVYYQLE